MFYDDRVSRLHHVHRQARRARIYVQVIQRSSAPEKFYQHRGGPQNKGWVVVPFSASKNALQYIPECVLWLSSAHNDHGPKPSPRSLHPDYLARRLSTAVRQSSQCKGG